MKKNVLFILTGLLLMASAIANAQNYNNSLRIAPGASNGYVAINGLTLDTLDFTVELWIKVDSEAYNGVTPFNDPSILGNKDWSSGANRGLELAIYTGGTYKVNFTPQGISRTDLVSSGPELMSRWNHIAVTVERMGYIRLYTNGILTDSTSISSGHGHSIDAVSMPYNFCDDGTGAYAHPFSGNVDEFRIWKGVRNTSQIRQYMCRTLPAGAANLLVYYPMQQNSGTIVTDVSGNGHNGTLTNLTPTAWQPSNAAVGDSSANLYTTTWTGQSVTVASPGSGVFSANNISTGMTGIQVYRTNYPPNSNTGITYPGTDSVYYGVYPVSTTSTYQVSCDYTNYPAAITYENGISLFNRPNVTTSWSSLSATKNTSTNLIQSVNTSAYRHFVIGNLTNTVNVQQISAAEHEITVYPNPSANGTITLKSATAEKMQLDIYNILGTIVRSVPVENWPCVIDISELAAGTYLANCYNNTKSETFKISIIK